MTKCNHYAADSLTNLIAAFDRFNEAGIDPTFDTDMEEMERQFAELRLTLNEH